MVTAIVFIRTGLDSVNEVAEAVAGIAGVSEVYSVTGDLDLVALVRVRALDDVSAVVTDGISKVAGIVGTETHIAFRTYSKHDLESAFAIGLD
jgi:DNA-binding Lrp family transcriptional regulator